jgi:hypothetical protein
LGKEENILLLVYKFRMTECQEKSFEVGINEKGGSKKNT